MVRLQFPTGTVQYYEGDDNSEERIYCEPSSPESVLL